MDRNGRDDNWNLRSDSHAHLLYSIFCGFAPAVPPPWINDYHSVGTRLGVKEYYY